MKSDPKGFALRLCVGGLVVGIGFVAAGMSCSPESMTEPIYGDPFATPPSSDSGPSGIYLNQLSGQISGTEVVQVLASGEDGTYKISTLDGEGVVTQIGADGSIAVGGAIGGQGTATGTGQFADDWNSFTLDTTVSVSEQTEGVPYNYSAARIEGTSVRFPVLGTAQPTNCFALGSYRATVTTRNLVTGAIVNQGSDTVTASFVGNSFRLTLGTGAYYQGIFLSELYVGFRVVEGAVGSYATFSGSANNVSQDMAGFWGLDDSCGMTGTLVFQTRAARGQQEQAQVTLVGQISGQCGAGCEERPSDEFTIVVANQSYETQNVRVYASSDHDLSKCDFVRGRGVLQLDVDLSFSGSVTHDLSALTWQSFVVAVTPLVETGCRDSDCLEWVGVVSDVLRQPENFDQNDTISFGIGGSTSSCYGIEIRR